MNFLFIQWTTSHATIHSANIALTAHALNTVRSLTSSKFTLRDCTANHMLNGEVSLAKFLLHSNGRNRRNVLECILENTNATISPRDWNTRVRKWKTEPRCGFVSLIPYILCWIPCTETAVMRLLCIWILKSFVYPEEISLSPRVYIFIEFGTRFRIICVGKNGTHFCCRNNLSNSYTAMAARFGCYCVISQNPLPGAGTRYVMSIFFCWPSMKGFTSGHTPATQHSFTLQRDT